MEMTALFQAETFNWYAWVVLPILIFIARVFDVTLGTLRIIFTSRGRRNLAPLLGFFEVLIWIMVIGQLVRNIESLTAYIGYAAGFAAGNYAGMWLENRLALGTFILRIIVSEGGDALAEAIHKAGFGVTCVDAKGAAGQVKLIYTIVKRRHVKAVLDIIHQAAPKAFVSIEDVHSTEKGVFPTSAAAQQLGLFGRKSK